MAAPNGPPLIPTTNDAASIRHPPLNCFGIRFRAPRASHMRCGGGLRSESGSTACASAEAVLDDLTHVGLCRLRAEVGQNPGRSCLAPGAELSAGCEIDHELERRGVVASLLHDLAGELGQCVWARQLDREESVPAHSAADGAPVGPAGRDPDGDPRPLHRAGLELAGPELGEANEPVIESLRPLAGIDDLPEWFELTVSVTAEPDAED